MRIRTVHLQRFKRFDDLTIDLGATPKKIVALVGPNGCGKSSIFDGFEKILKRFRNYGDEGEWFFSKAMYQDRALADGSPLAYNPNEPVKVELIDGELNRKSFYIRTAYRFTAKLDVRQLQATPKILETHDEPISSIELDARLLSNYQRLLGSAYTEFFRGALTGAQVREKLIQKMNTILSNIIDAQISDIGDILQSRGQLYFSKGSATDFPYANLSAGEKEVVDLVIDLVVKTEEYKDTAICIDEPELHLNTSVQRKLLIEIEKLIPDTCQLWVATHSIGFMRALQRELSNKSQVLDFSAGNYFAGSTTIRPATPSRANWMRIFKTALDDLAGLISPKRIVYCEGRADPAASGAERGLDANVYNKIFASEYQDTVFVSSGGNTELDQRSDVAFAVLSKVFTELEVLVLKDCDISSGAPTTPDDRKRYLHNNLSYHRVLERREIENYLFDKVVLKAFCAQEGTEFDEIAYETLVDNISTQDVKQYTSRIRKICGINTSISAEVFKVNLAAVVTPEMLVYKELARCIFQAPTA